MSFDVPPFLLQAAVATTLFWAYFAVGVVLIWVIRQWVHRATPVLPEELTEFGAVRLGYLYGGPPRATLVALAGLMARGRVRCDDFSDDGTLLVIEDNTGEESADPVEAIVLHAIESGVDQATTLLESEWVLTSVADALQEFDAQLEQKGWLFPPRRAAWSRAVAALTAIALILMGLGLAALLDGPEPAPEQPFAIFAGLAYGYTAVRRIPLTARLTPDARKELQAYATQQHAWYRQLGEAAMSTDVPYEPELQDELTQAAALHGYETLHWIALREIVEKRLGKRASTEWRAFAHGAALAEGRRVARARDYQHGLIGLFIDEADILIKRPPKPSPPLTPGDARRHTPDEDGMRS